MADTPVIIPSWLNPNVERPFHKEGLTKEQFVLGCMTCLLHIGCDPFQSAGVTANTCNEAAWGSAVVCGNAFGWKITQNYADHYRIKNGKPAPWWKAPGHVASGDPEWCFYRAFESYTEGLPEWLSAFTPKPSELPIVPTPPAKDSYIYRQTGEAFWSGGDWFPLLCKAGYKGPITKAKPDASIAEHKSIVHTVLAMWAQSRLTFQVQSAITDYQIEQKLKVTNRLMVDGDIGPQSINAIKAFQRMKGMVVTGTMSDALILALACT